jgi:hypothetical protein
VLSQGLLRHLKEEHAMAEDRMPVLDALPKGEETEHDPLRELVRWAVQELMEA